MENSNIKKTEDLTENIENKDWPLLKELESTRFSIKNKKDKKLQTLSLIKEISDKEDKQISEQNLIDEKLVTKFLNEKQTENSIKTNENVTVSNRSNIVKENPVAFVNNNNLKEKTVDTKELFSNNKKPKEEVSKLIAVGMAKIYISKTDSILNPLRFIMRNSLQIVIAMLQFIIPGIITWYLTTNVQTVSNQLNKESLILQCVYISIFYFACMFLWVTMQVILSGFINMLKYSLSNLIKAGKN